MPGRYRCPPAPILDGQCVISGGTLQNGPSVVGCPTVPPCFSRFAGPKNGPESKAASRAVMSNSPSANGITPPGFLAAPFSRSRTQREKRLGLGRTATYSIMPDQTGTGRCLIRLVGSFGDSLPGPDRLPSSSASVRRRITPECEQPIPKDPEKVGKTGPWDGQGSGLGQRDSAIPWACGKGRRRDGVADRTE